MKLPIAILIVVALVIGVGVPVRPVAAQVAESGYIIQTPEELQSLVAPVALYPDAMLAQILVASTYPNDVVAATQYLDSGADPNQIDDQGWDLSVSGIARYPDLLHYMTNNGAWMNSLGAAYLNQQADVMNAVQVMRSQAMAAGNLVSNQYEQVVVDGGTIEIIPTDPNNIYPPIYDPALVYQPPVIVVGVPFVPLIHFWHGIPCGIWLHHDIDWHDHMVYVGSWGLDRPWWHHDVHEGRWDYTQDRPGLHPFHGDIVVHDHNKVINVRGGAWNRQMHDPIKPMPRFTPRPEVHHEIARPGAGYEPREVEPRKVEHSPAISGYNHGPTVIQQRDRGQASRTSAGIRAEPSRPVEAPARHAVSAPRVEPHEEPSRPRR